MHVYTNFNGVQMLLLLFTKEKADDIFFSGAITLFSKLHYVKVLALVRMLHIILYACSLTSGVEHATKLEKINHCHLVPLSFRRFRKTPSGYPISLFEWDLLVISLKKQRE